MGVSGKMLDLWMTQEKKRGSGLLKKNQRKTDFGGGGQKNKEQISLKKCNWKPTEAKQGAADNTSLTGNVHMALCNIRPPFLSAP